MTAGGPRGGARGSGGPPHSAGEGVTSLSPSLPAGAPRRGCCSGSLSCWSPPLPRSRVTCTGCCGMLGRGVPAAVPGVPCLLPVLKPPIPWEALLSRNGGWSLPSGQMLCPAVVPAAGGDPFHGRIPRGCRARGGPVCSIPSATGRGCWGNPWLQLPRRRAVCQVRAGCGTGGMALPQSGRAPCLSGFSTSPPCGCMSWEALSVVGSLERVPWGCNTSHTLLGFSLPSGLPVTSHFSSCWCAGRGEFSADSAFQPFFPHEAHEPVLPLPAFLVNFTSPTEKLPAGCQAG